MNQVIMNQVEPGDVVVSEFDGYQHYAIVSDTRGPDGKPNLISATNRNKTVKEEPWDTVTKGRHTYVASCNCQFSPDEIVQRAKSKTNHWCYDVLTNNCEHFVFWVISGNTSSTQVKGAVGGGIVGFGLTHLLSDNPTTEEKFFGSLLGAFFGVQMSKAPHKIKEESQGRIPAF